MNLRAEIVRDLEHEIEIDLGSDEVAGQPRSMLWRNRVFPCVVTSTTDATLLDVGASPVETTRAVIVRRHLFLNDTGEMIVPKSGDFILLANTAYKVATVREDALGATVRLNLADKDNAR